MGISLELATLNDLYFYPAIDGPDEWTPEHAKLRNKYHSRLIKELVKQTGKTPKPIHERWSFIGLTMSYGALHNFRLLVAFVSYMNETGQPLNPWIDPLSEQESRGWAIADTAYPHLFSIHDSQTFLVPYSFPRPFMYRHPAGEFGGKVPVGSAPELYTELLKIKIGFKDVVKSKYNIKSRFPLQDTIEGELLLDLLATVKTANKRSCTIMVT